MGHALGLALLALAAGCAGLLVLWARPVSTGIALALRQLAYLALAFGPAVLVAWACARQPPLTPARLLQAYALGGLALGAGFALAGLAFPGPWLSDE